MCTCGGTPASAFQHHPCVVCILAPINIFPASRMRENALRKRSLFYSAVIPKVNHLSGRILSTFSPSLSISLLLALSYLSTVQLEAPQTEEQWI